MNKKEHYYVISEKAYENLAEAFDMSFEKLKQIKEDGIVCPECGEFLENLGEAIDHECLLKNKNEEEA